MLAHIRCVTSDRDHSQMVLVAPSRPPVRRRGSATGRGAAAGVVPSPARHEVLALLRQGAGQRPRFDPGLAGGLRAWLEDAAGSLVAARGEEAPALFLGTRELLSGSPRLPVSSSDAYPAELVTSALVHALFRQIVMTGSAGDPLADALDALSVHPGRQEMVRHVRAQPEPARAALRAALTTHVTHLLDLTPRFAPAWLPRTDDRVAIPLAGGRVVLRGTFDLLVGAPLPGTATLCALGLTTGGRWAEARTALHYLALLETLRSGTPPFRLALLHSLAGRYGVEDVLEEHLRAMVGHLVAQLSTLPFGDADG